MKNNKNGITLIALVITIIVLLILAGISISLVTGQNGVLIRAEDASNTYSIASAKEQANMRAAGYVSEYTEKFYVDNDLTVGSMTTGEYVLQEINGQEDGDYRYSVSGSTITVTSKTTGETLASGTVDDNGGIAWSDSVASGGNNSNNTTNTTNPNTNTTNTENTVSTNSTGHLGYFKQIGTKAYYYASASETTGTEITGDNLGDYLGMKVDYTPDGKITVNGDEVGTSSTYRIFFIDVAGKYGTAGTIYLKADQDRVVKCVFDLPAVSTGDDIVTTFNPLWSANPTYSGNPKTNMTYVNRLLDKNIWDAYKDDGTTSAGIANYVVGAPSLEMWIDAYNVFLTKYPVTGKETCNCTVTRDTTTLLSDNTTKKGPVGPNNGYGYYVGHGENYTEQSGYYMDNNSLVVPSSYTSSWGTEYAVPKDRVKAYAGSGGDYYWLASPSACDGYYLMHVRTDVKKLGWVSSGDLHSFCPLVCCNSGVNIYRAE